MKLLFDQNISPRLIERMQDIFPESSHVSLLGLDSAMDAEVWTYARLHGYILVSKDADFSEMSLLNGFPPKVIWLRIGNCTTGQIESLLRANADLIQSFILDRVAGVFELS